MPFFTVLGTALSTTANFATTTTGVTTSGNWISKHTAGSSIKRCRNSLHNAMNILNDILKEDMPVPEDVILEIRRKHEM